MPAGKGYTEPVSAEDTMRTARLAIVLIAFIPSLAAQSKQTLDEIIAGYLKTSGGVERIRAVKSVRRVGKILGSGGFEAAYRQENKRPNKVREETNESVRDGPDVFRF